MAKSGIRSITLTGAFILTAAVLLAAAPVAAQSTSVCDSISIEELDSLGPLTYGTATPDFAGCSYEPATPDETHSVRVFLAPFSAVKSLPEAFPGGTDAPVGERLGYFIDGTLFVQLAGGTASIEPRLGENVAGVDALAYATAIAQVAAPRLDEIVAARAAAVVVADENVPATLCDVLTKDELNSLSPLQYDDPPGFAASETVCRYDAAAQQEGDHRLDIGLGGSLQDLKVTKLIEPDGEDLTIADHEAYWSQSAVYVPLGESLLTVRASFAESPAAEGIDAREYLVAITEIVLANLDDRE